MGRYLSLGVAVSLLVVLLAIAARAEDWPHVGNDPGGTRYSPLKQIQKNNVRQLRIAWTYRLGEITETQKYPTFTAFEATPLVVDGVLYVPTPYARLVALDAETGKELWTFDPKVNRDRPGPEFVNRGVAYWSNGKERRLFLGTPNGRLFAIDAATGKPAPGFGQDGFIDLRKDVADQFPAARYGLSSPVVVYKDLIIVGARSPDGEPQGPSGDIRAFEARTGKLVWRFHIVPRAGEFGNDTWQGDSWKDRAGVNPWSMMSVDTERGIVVVPLTSAATDFYGGDRQGQNLFADCILALDAASGRRLWHFQTIHHDLWDWDLPAQPNLVTVRRNGRNVPAVAQVTKTGFVFLLDRLTGKPLFDVVERSVPKSPVPGEQSWPTQPFPVKPPPFARQTMSFDEAASSFTISGRWEEPWCRPCHRRETGGRSPCCRLRRTLRNRRSYHQTNVGSPIASTESGRNEVYVQRFSGAGPSCGGKWQISANGGRSPAGGATAKSSFASPSITS